MSRPSEVLNITVNGQDIALREDFGSSVSEFLTAISWEAPGVSEWIVYRKETYVITSKEECSEPMVVSDGDEFIIVPDYDFLQDGEGELVV